MKIDYELKIQKRYFDAILQLKKPFELRHEPIKEGSIIKLVEMKEPILINKEEGTYFSSATGRYIIFKSGECEKLTKLNYYEGNSMQYYFGRTSAYYLIGIDFEGDEYELSYEGYDNFCGDYINEKQTYLIEIAEILEVK